MHGADLTLRKSTDSWLKLQSGRTEGPGVASRSFRMTAASASRAAIRRIQRCQADGYRADLSVGFGDFFEGGKGRLTLYTQNQDAGYSAPGLATLPTAQHYGGTMDLPIGEQLSVSARPTIGYRIWGSRPTRAELDVGYQLNDRWSVATGVRSDKREDHRPWCR